MTHQEMIDHVSGELWNTKIQSRITSWLNMAIVDIASKYVFGHLHGYNTVATVASTPDVSLAADFFWLKTIGIPADTRKIWPEDEARLAEAYPNYRTLTGTITHYYLNGNVLGLFQVPSGIKTIGYSYQKRPTKLSALSDTSNLPEEWHELICQKAITKGYNYESNAEGTTKSVALENQMLKRLGAYIYRRTDETVIMGGSNYRTRPPRPRLPSNYPSMPGF